MNKVSRDRRRLIGTAAALFGLGLVFPGARALAGPIPLHRSDLAENMAALFTPRASAEVVGQAYLETLPPDHRCPEALEQAICLGRCPVGEARRLGVNELHARLAHWIAEDFRARSLVSVEGWLLSQTEARIAGLTATLNAPAARGLSSRGTPGSAGT